MTTPAGMTYTSLQNDPMLNGTVFLNATWTPQQNQVGTHLTCAIAEDVIGYMFLYFHFSHKLNLTYKIGNAIFMNSL